MFRDMQCQVLYRSGFRAFTVIGQHEPAPRGAAQLAGAVRTRWTPTLSAKRCVDSIRGKIKGQPWQWATSCDYNSLAYNPLAKYLNFALQLTLRLSNTLISCKRMRVCRECLTKDEHLSITNLSSLHSTSTTGSTVPLPCCFRVLRLDR